MSTISLLFACSFSIFSVRNWWKNKYFSSSVTTTKHSFILNTFKNTDFHRGWRKVWKLLEYHRLPYSKQHPWAISSEYCVPIGYPRGQDEPILRFPALIPRKKRRTAWGWINKFGNFFWKCYRWSFKSGRRQSKQKKAWTSFVNLLYCKNRSSKFDRSFLIILKLKRNLFAIQ